MIQKLKKLYADTIVTNLLQKFNYKNKLKVPRITKIIVNRGLGIQNAKIIDSCLNELSIIASQQSIITYSKKAVASFNLQTNVPIGVSVTLRGNRMYAFLDRLLNLALPRIRDFRGISLQSFDGRGNYNLGFEEQLMFPEIDYNTISGITGMNICIVTNSKTDSEAFALLKEFGMPFKFK